MTRNTSLKETGTAKIIMLGSANAALLLGAAVEWDCRFFFPDAYDSRILYVTGVYFLAALVALCSTGIALRVLNTTENVRNLRVVIAFAILFRLIHLFATPFLEVDYFRYMWDGIVCNQGVSPYRYSPDEILAEPTASANPDQQRLADVAANNPSLQTIVSSVHFPEYTTIYPPVSQAVFAITMGMVPNSGSVELHRFAMKTILILFDLATIFTLLRLLRLVAASTGWIIVYAWNPLVIKEIANSGHLDSIAVFLTTAAVTILVAWLKHAASDAHKRRSGKARLLGFSALLLALGVGAKIFPVILLPLFAVVLWQTDRRAAIIYCSVFALATVLFMTPMFLHRISLTGGTGSQAEASATSRKEGLSSFLSEWRMNDIIFSTIYENAKLDRNSQHNQAWYVATPKTVRVRWHEFIRRSHLSGNPAFFAARLLTLAAFCVYYLTILIGLVKRPASAEQLPSLVFGVICVFFFLQPTQNPWYWLWALPFVCFARNPGWLLVAPCLIGYYLRFWCKHSGVAIAFAGYEYSGGGVFDHCIVWLEFLPVLIAISVCRSCKSLVPHELKT